ncbi:MAG: FHA domain-containing protein [Anaerolineae bacterium]|nr:FHA domain-containing protein [Anaerolineae bacterium]
MASQSFQLVTRVGPSPGKVFELTKTEMYIGRDTTNEISINDAEISRRHVRLLKQGSGYSIEDLGSTNGTFVNGERISGVFVLQPGQTIRFGDNVTLSYEIAGYDPDATVASGQAPPRKAPQGFVGNVPASPARAAGGGKMKEMMNNRTLVIGCGAVLVIGLCIGITALWYIDANALWCDVFGGLIPGCR